MFPTKLDLADCIDAIMEAVGGLSGWATQLKPKKDAKMSFIFR